MKDQFKLGCISKFMLSVSRPARPPPPRKNIQRQEGTGTGASRERGTPRAAGAEPRDGLILTAMRFPKSHREKRTGTLQGHQVSRWEGIPGREGDEQD